MFERTLALTDHQLMERIFARSVQTSGIEQLERLVPPRDGAREGIPGRAGDRRDDGPAGARHAVEEGRFADVRAADENNGQASLGHAKLSLASALTA